MILCNKDCIPCCDYCIHAIHEHMHVNGKMVSACVSGCSKHTDDEHQTTAVGCGYCEDFHCKNAK